MKKVAKFMRIILLKDIANLGKTGEIKIVRPGFARNYLIPQGLAAFPQDPQAREVFSKFAKKKKEENLRKEEIAQKLATLDGQKILFKVKVNKKGQPYKAIQYQEIAQKLQIAENVIETEPIKTLGEHEIILKSGNSQAKIKVVLEAEK